jgi:hypothetical protein
MQAKMPAKHIICFYGFYNEDFFILPKNSILKSEVHFAIYFWNGNIFSVNLSKVNAVK